MDPRERKRASIWELGVLVGAERGISWTVDLYICVIACEREYL